MMPIINSKKGIHKHAIKVQLNPVVLEKIHNYCQWAGIYDLGYFIEKAANAFFLQDRDWILQENKLEDEADPE